jgi:hypothetical protein
MKTQRIVQRFHSKSLIPFHIIELSRAKGEDVSNLVMCDTIMDWLEQQQMSYRFKDGEEVVHKENIDLKMEVVKIDKEIFRVKNKDGSTSDKLRMKGVDCSWWL